MLAALFLPLLAAALPAEAMPSEALPAEDAPAPLASRITEVVVHGSSARVHRSAQLAGSGRYVLAGLPASLDADAVRVRLTQGSVVAVEVADRWQQAVPDAQVQALRDQLRALDWQGREIEDQRNTLKALREGVERLLVPPSSGSAPAAAPDPAAWKQVLAFASEQLAALTAQLRDADRAGVEVDTRRKDIQAQLGHLQGHDALHLRDVVVEVLLPGPAVMDLEYLVADAGWEPVYDLRASADGRQADLVYRARVWQQTGESWDDVALVLSTSQPERGARGPEPQPLRLRVERPQASAPAAMLSGRGRHGERDDLAETEMSRLQALGYAGDAAKAAEVAEPVVSVESFGLAVQFRLPRAESVPSRERPVTVLVGQQALDVELQRLCVPALDSTVWVRGLTRNSTPWAMLPGNASVYFGQDYVGPARFDEPVLPEQEFTLHLGADPGLKVERIKTAELHEAPGVFDKDQSDTVAFRVRLSNQGSRPARPDGAVEVLVREAMPLAADERIEIEVRGENQKWAPGERWLKECNELGIRTWSVLVPTGGSADVTWEIVTQWPGDVRLEAGA